MRYEVYFIDSGDEIFATESLDAGTDQHAVELAQQLFRSSIARGYEIWRKNRCVHRERHDPNGATISPPRRGPAPLRDYTLDLYSDVGRLTGSLALRAAGDDEAAITAAVLFEACSDLCAGYAVTCEGVTIPTVGRLVRPLTPQDVNAHTQQIVMDREIALRDSKSIVRQSRQLLERIDSWLGEQKSPAARQVR